MFTINIPNKYSARDVYKNCIDGVSSADLLNKFTEISVIIHSYAKLYEIKVEFKELFEFNPINGDHETIIKGSITKKDLKNLYTQYMVGKTKDARKIYDYLLALSEVCPFCGFGHVYTLDHYLPKSKFPCFAVLPINLAPSCRDCNTTKTNRISNDPGQQVMHPYFDSNYFTSEQWLFAEVEETSPIRIKYFVKSPPEWPQLAKERVKAHFDAFDLSSRFSIQAGTELSTPAVPSFIRGNPISVKEYLTEKYSEAFSLHKNSWKTALYHALANSDWYCNGGYTE